MSNSDRTIYSVRTESGVELGAYSGDDARDAVRRALKDAGYTVHPDPYHDDKLLSKNNVPVHVACDYRAGGETVRVRPISDRN